MDDESFREKLRGALKRSCDCVDRFLHICHYQSGQYDSPEDFAKLNARLNDMEVTQCLRYVENGQERFVCSKNRLFYYAIPPSQFNPVSKCIHGSCLYSLWLIDTCMENEGYDRIVVEKPFGRDYDSSRELNTFLQSLFAEESIYVFIAE